MCTSAFYCDIDTVAQLYVSQSSQCAGSAAELAATRKSFKYCELSTSHFFVHITLESLDPVCSQALSFLCELGLQCSVAFERQRIVFNVFQKQCSILTVLCLSVRLQMRVLIVISRPNISNYCNRLLFIKNFNSTKKN